MGPPGQPKSRVWQTKSSQSWEATPISLDDESAPPSARAGGITRRTSGAWNPMLATWSLEVPSSQQQNTSIQPLLYHGLQCLRTRALHHNHLKVPLSEDAVADLTWRWVTSLNAKMSKQGFIHRCPPLSMNSPHTF